MFIAALTIAKPWREPKSLSADECIRKMWYIYTMEYYSAIKEGEILPFGTTGMDLEGILLNEISETKKEKYHTISHICVKKQNQPTNKQKQNQTYKY